MIVTVLYYDEMAHGYGGNEYTYRTELPLQPFQKVLAPTVDGLKRALVTQINLPESAIKPEWADRVKEIKELDK